MSLTGIAKGGLAEALERLDRRLHHEIRRLRTRSTLSLDELRGLYVSDEHVDRLLASAGDDGGPRDAEPPSPAAALLGEAPWRHLREAYALSTFDLDVLFLALVREIDSKYETLFGYLNDDVTRKWPTRGLALRLCAGDAPAQRMARARLGEGAPLLSAGLVRVLDSAEHPSWLATGLVLPPLVSHFLLGIAELESHLSPTIETLDAMRWDDVPVTTEIRTRLERLSRLVADAEPGRAPLVLLTGTIGSGRTRATAALAGALGVRAIALDFGTRISVEQWAECARGAVLYQQLTGSAIMLRGVEPWWDREGTLRPEARRVLGALTLSRGAVVLAVEPGGRWRDTLGRRRVIELALDVPPASARHALWAQALGTTSSTPAPDDVVLGALADRFALAPGQIARAAQAADDARAIDGREGTPAAGALFEAARASTREALGALAVRAPMTHGWDDLVLPPPTLRVLREIAEAVRHRAVVLDAWGFARRVPGARGLKALFAGGSGTGKTMAAAVIARALDVDLFVIDLAGVVSKYIGETEKNLDRIFRAACSSNAILFFDEADALFGKRSEVKDAHDRYANIEVAYLLQKMEAHEGVVMLASNLPRNLDAAFARRMQYVVEFALPGETDRERLWHGMFPVETPLGEDVDLPFLARQFPLAGGDIRNVALDAAFLAAQNGRVVRMVHLVRAMARQITKQGRVPAAEDFKHYYALISAE